MGKTALISVCFLLLPIYKKILSKSDEDEALKLVYK